MESNQKPQAEEEKKQNNVAVQDDDFDSMLDDCSKDLDKKLNINDKPQ